MLRPRITPCLLVHKRGLVKTVGFKQPKYVGDPVNAVKIFNEKEADELIVLDIDASVDGAEPDFTMIGQLAVECRMPLCYGGGIRTASQARRVISLGVEKVSVSAAAVQSPDIVSAIAEEIGSQSVVVTLDVRRAARGNVHEVWTHNGTRNSKRTAIDLALEMESRGAGEIVINSIDQDGAMKGYDLVLAKQMRDATRIPLTVLGGAGALADIGKLLDVCGVVGAAAGSLFVFKGMYKAVLINYPTPAQKEALTSAALSR